MSDNENSALLELDFDCEALLSRDRHALFHPVLLQSLRDELEQDLGSDRANIAALQMGCLLGIRDGLEAAGSLSWVTPAPDAILHPALPIRCSGTTRVNSALALHGSWPAAGESKAQANMAVDACMVSMGYTSGWLSASTGFDLLALETSCRADGDEACCFTALERKGWAILDDLRVDRMLGALPIRSLRALAMKPARPEFDAVPHAGQEIEVEESSVQLWPPLMVLHSPHSESSLRALELFESDPATQGVSVAILHFQGRATSGDCTPSAFLPFLAAADALGVDVIYSAPPVGWESRLAKLPNGPFAETLSLEEAIGLGLQIARAQHWKV